MVVKEAHFGMTNQDVSINYRCFMVYDCLDKCFYKDEKLYDLCICDSDAPMFYDTLEKLSQVDKISVSCIDCEVKNPQGKWVKQHIEFVVSEPKKKIILTFSHCNNEESVDELTGLLTRTAFAERLEEFADSEGDGINERLVVYFDVHHFKVVNDMFGLSDGDRLLKYIADVIKKAVGGHGRGCRIEADRFVFFTYCDKENMSAFIEKFLEEVSAFDMPFEIICNAGIYMLTDEKLSTEAIIDRAIIAQAQIKGSYTRRYNFYTETLRKNLLSEQEITGMMRSALKQRQFVVYYQPQYNHSTGMLVGAEALVRWKHPEKGVISPAVFIPVFEKNGFITELDSYMFESVCIFIRKCIDENLPMVPVSTNLTRYDIFSHGFIENLEAIRKKYDIPSEYIRLEITESVALGNSRFINEAVGKLHSYGFVVEMDDFGSGYSSLNILKDIDCDIIKLDMKFLEKSDDGNNRGGTILSSVVRMVNWLKLPTIAEGVETIQQADFLKSVGCDYIQGYLYSKPLPEEEYIKILRESNVGTIIPQMDLIDTLNAENFWSAESLETLIFSNFVGGAGIFEYKDGIPEILRVNDKYLKELGMNLTEKELVNSRFLDTLDDASKKIYTSMLDRAIETREEQECETWRTISSKCCGKDRICIRANARLIGKSKNNFLFYVMIRNITQEKMYSNQLVQDEKRFRMASEQIDIYCWEYTVATKEMRPCFRCIRDLGLPALLTNYPDSAIEMGIFPPEAADMYRDWHRQIAAGVPKLEAVIPLTEERIPYIVRYTTEFDENGRAVKAYGPVEPVR